MYHTIRFAIDRWVDLESSPQNRLERLLIRAGMQAPAQLRPYVVEGLAGPVEVADLFFEDGSVIRGVPFACFFFVEQGAF